MNAEAQDQYNVSNNIFENLTEDEKVSFQNVKYVMYSFKC